jgi:hypothetical protein
MTNIELARDIGFVYSVHCPQGFDVPAWVRGVAMLAAGPVPPAAATTVAAGASRHQFTGTIHPMMPGEPLPQQHHQQQQQREQDAGAVRGASGLARGADAEGVAGSGTAMVDATAVQGPAPGSSTDSYSREVDAAIAGHAKVTAPAIPGTAAAVAAPSGQQDVDGDTFMSGGGSGSGGLPANRGGDASAVEVASTQPRPLGYFPAQSEVSAAPPPSPASVAFAHGSSLGTPRSRAKAAANRWDVGPEPPAAGVGPGSDSDSAATTARNAAAAALVLSQAAIHGARLGLPSAGQSATPAPRAALPGVVSQGSSSPSSPAPSPSHVVASSLSALGLAGRGMNDGAGAAQ